MAFPGHNTLVYPRIMKVVVMVWSRESRWQTDRCSCRCYQSTDAVTRHLVRSYSWTHIPWRNSYNILLRIRPLIFSRMWRSKTLGFVCLQRLVHLQQRPSAADRNEPSLNTEGASKFIINPWRIYTKVMIKNIKIGYLTWKKIMLFI